MLMPTRAHPDVGWMPYIWLIFLGYLFIDPVVDGGWVEWAITLGSVAVFLPLYFSQFSDRRRRRLVASVAIAVLGFARCCPSIRARTRM